MNSLFTYKDYKLYLRDWIHERGHGAKSKIAKALGCHLAYLSLVLSGDAHLSQEQTETLASYLSLSDEEIDFLLLLLLRARAGTKNLEHYYQKKIDAILAHRLQVKNRVATEKKISQEHQSKYFSSWHYAAVHLAVGIKSLQTIEEISAYLSLPHKLVKTTLEFLIEINLIEWKKNRYVAEEQTIHLGNDSPWIKHHHMNWRVLALDSLSNEKPEELHYSSAITIAQSDLPKIKEELLRAIEKARAIVKNSTEEKLYCYNLDLFEVRKH